MQITCEYSAEFKFCVNLKDDDERVTKKLILKQNFVKLSKIQIICVWILKNR